MLPSDRCHPTPLYRLVIYKTTIIHRTTPYLCDFITQYDNSTSLNSIFNKTLLFRHKMKNIPLDKNKTIAFLGSMNAFPMMYALILKKYGYEVIYVVDVPQSDTLSRPENHYPSIKYPYPDWIVEWKLPLQIVLLLSPKLFASHILSTLKKYNKKPIGCFVLNGFFISLAPYLRKATIVALSHGSDLDVWADVDNMEKLREGIFQSPSYAACVPTGHDP